MMTSAVKLRDEAQILRELATRVNEPELVAKVMELVEELERLARVGDNGDAS